MTHLFLLHFALGQQGYFYGNLDGPSIFRPGKRIHAPRGFFCHESDKKPTPQSAEPAFVYPYYKIFIPVLTELFIDELCALPR